MSSSEGVAGQAQTFTIRPCTVEDLDIVLELINESTRVYKDFLPPAAYHEPTITRDELGRELSRIRFFAAVTPQGEVIGVMGYEKVRDAALLRHGYIRPEWQRRGVGSALLRHCESEITGVRKLIAGTYATNRTALGFCEKHGYKLDPHSDAILRRYYEIPDVQREHSVALTKDPPPTNG